MTVRFRGALATVPGRVTLAVRVPPDLLVEADALAARLGVDRALLLGDLVAAELPGALAEAADDLFGRAARDRLGGTALDAATPAGSAAGAASTSSPESGQGPRS